MVVSSCIVCGGWDGYSWVLSIVSFWQLTHEPYMTAWAHGEPAVTAQMIVLMNTKLGTRHQHSIKREARTSNSKIWSYEPLYEPSPNSTVYQHSVQCNMYVHSCLAYRIWQVALFCWLEAMPQKNLADARPPCPGLSPPTRSFQCIHQVSLFVVIKFVEAGR